MDRICDYNDCTGCALCTAVCPKSCISMKKGGLGHLYPVIDPASCIDCGACSGACPANSCRPGGRTSRAFSSPVSAYAAWAKDESEYMTSTSGGAASVLGRHVISRGGVVYGSAFCPGDPSEGRPFAVRHIRVENEAGLQKLKGSKYVQSSMAEILPSLKEDVRSGRLVLFIGTPCQVAAVRCMFGKRPENLLLVDIVCHGVPSLSLLTGYIKDNLHIPPENVLSLSFRGEDGFCMKIGGPEVSYSHRPLSGRRTEDLYYNLFMDAFTYRESCYRCLFAGDRRISDMTVGDFWGLGKDVPEHPYGVSLILPVSPAGQNLVSALKDNMEIYGRPVAEAVSGNEQLRSPRHKSMRIKIFRKLFPVFGLKVYYLLVMDWIIRKRLASQTGIKTRI